MESAVEGGRYPTGTGWVAGFALGALVGLLAWAVTTRVAFGLILFAATGTALGAALEQSIRTRELTRREHRLAWVLAVTGVLFGLVLLAYSLQID